MCFLSFTKLDHLQVINHCKMYKYSHPRSSFNLADNFLRVLKETDPLVVCIPVQQQEAHQQ